MCIERIFIQNLHFLLCNGYTNSFRVWWYKVTSVFLFVFFSFFFIFFFLPSFLFFYFNLHSSSKDMRDILWVKRICENVRKLLRSNRNSTVRPCTNIELNPTKPKLNPKKPYQIRSTMARVGAELRKSRGVAREVASVLRYSAILKTVRG